MHKLIFALTILFLISLYSCDDGDVITFNLDFNDEFEACQSVSGLILYKTKSDPSESLSVFINNYTVDEMLNVGEDNTFEDTRSGTFNYRTYNNVPLNNLFCSNITPSDIIITNDDESSCDVLIRTTLTEDDNDDIPSNKESTNGINPLGDDDNDGVFNYLDDAPNDNTVGNANGNIEDGFDTDGDGLPDFLDIDDDGDNVITNDENPDPNGDGDLSDAQDTDGDGIPDYLDDDDDGDGTLTRDEEKGVQDQNPKNDETNSDVGPDYLNPDVSDVLPATAYRNHNYTRTFLVNATILDLDLTELSQDELFFGILTGVNNTTENVTVIPDFN